MLPPGGHVHHAEVRHLFEQRRLVLVTVIIGQPEAAPRARAEDVQLPGASERECVQSAGRGGRHGLVGRREQRHRAELVRVADGVLEALVVSAAPARGRLLTPRAVAEGARV